MHWWQVTVLTDLFCVIYIYICMSEKHRIGVLTLFCGYFHNQFFFLNNYMYYKKCTIFSHYVNSDLQPLLRWDLNSNWVLLTVHFSSKHVPSRKKTELQEIPHFKRASLWHSRLWRVLRTWKVGIKVEVCSSWGWRSRQRKTEPASVVFTDNTKAQQAQRSHVMSLLLRGGGTAKWARGQVVAAFHEHLPTIKSFYIS